MMIYEIRLATPGNSTTSGTANTPIEVFSCKPGTTRSDYFSALRLRGKGVGATQLNAVTMRMYRWGTASTSGTSITPAPRDPSGPAAVSTVASLTTAGTTKTNQGPIISCGVTGADTWLATIPDDMISVAAGNAGSLAAEDNGTVASMPYEWSGEYQEW